MITDCYVPQGFYPFLTLDVFHTYLSFSSSRKPDISIWYLQ